VPEREGKKGKKKREKTADQETRPLGEMRNKEDQAISSLPKFLQKGEKRREKKRKEGEPRKLKRVSPREKSAEAHQPLLCLQGRREKEKKLAHPVTTSKTGHDTVLTHLYYFQFCCWRGRRGEKKEKKRRKGKAELRLGSH